MNLSSIAPAAFAAGWREKFRSQPRQVFSIYSLPDNDCPFEYDDQPLNDNDDHTRQTDQMAAGKTSELVKVSK